MCMRPPQKWHLGAPLRSMFGWSVGLFAHPTAAGIKVPFQLAFSETSTIEQSVPALREASHSQHGRLELKWGRRYSRAYQSRSAGAAQKTRKYLPPRKRLPPRSCLIVPRGHGLSSTSASGCHPSNPALNNATTCFHIIVIVGWPPSETWQSFGIAKSGKCYRRMRD